MDTGTRDTILAAKMYHLIPRGKRPQLEASTEVLTQADGTTLDVVGTATMELSVGNVRQVMKLVVAKIENDGLLGMDFLNAVGASINVPRGTLEIEGEVIHCQRVGGSGCYRVVATETVIVPPEHEQIILARASDCPEDTVGLVEPVEIGLLETKGLNVARAVVGVHDVVPVRVMNVHSTPRVVKRGMSIATLTPVDETEIICSSSETENACEDSQHDHVKELLKQTVTGLDSSYHEQVQDLLYKYSDVFSSSSYDIGRTDITKHHIHTGDAVPVRQPPRRKPPDQRVEIERQVQDLLKEGLITKSNSPWSSPVVLVSKKDGSKRLCIDYRQLNAVTTKDAYPLPRIDESLDALGGAQWFSTLDLASGYWQVELDDDAAKKSAFSTSSGLYEWKVLPFGLCNAPSTFERLMENVLSGLHWEILLIYLDDVIVFGSSIEEMITKLETVFQRFRGANLKLKPSKCALFRKEVKYLGHVVSSSGIHTDPDKVKDIREWPTPKCQKDVRSFLGIASYYRRFIEEFGKIAHPLHQLTEKKAIFRWTPECEQAFNTLKHKLTSAPILAFPTPHDLFVLDTDASGYALGAVLSQIQDGVERVIAYSSKSLTKEQRNYCTTRRELLAIITFLKKFRHYLLGRPVKVRTDHSSLKWLMNFKDADHQLARWREICAQYQLEVEYRPGKNHSNADCLSRKPCKQCGRQNPEPQKVQDADAGSVMKSVGTQYDIPSDCNEDCVQNTLVDRDTVQVHEQSQCLDEPEMIDSSIMPENTDTEADIATTRVVNVVALEPEVSLAEIRAEQLKDESIGHLLQLKENGSPKPAWEDIAPASPDMKTYWTLWPLLEVKGGVLTRRWVDGDGKTMKWLTILPAALRPIVLKELHSSKTAGHMGMSKTVAKVKSKYYWARLATDVRAYIRQCTTCARRKQPVPRKKAPLQQYQVGGPLERIALDIMGPLPETEDGNQYVLVIGDYFTKWVEAYPIPDQTVETVADKLVKEFCFRYGFPLSIHSDQGRNFEAKVFQEACKLFGVQKTRTTAYNPKSDGLIERFNRTILNAVSVMLEPLQHQRDWDQYLSYFGFAYRSCVQESTQETPNNMMFGREVRCPLDLLVEGPPHEEESSTDYVADLREKLRGAYERVRHTLQLSARRQKRNYNRNTKDPEYQVGDFVWLYSHQRKPGISRKLVLPWVGPYLVISKLCDVVFRIQRTPRCKPVVVHADRLKAYQGPPLRPWRFPEEQDAEENQRNEETQDNNKQMEGLQEPVPDNKDDKESETANTDNKDDRADTANTVLGPEPVGQQGQKAKPTCADKDSADKLPDVPTVPDTTTANNDNEQVRRNPPRNRRVPARYL